MSRVLIIGDLHTPFMREGFIDFLKKVYKDFNCNKVVQIGDLADQYCFTRFVRNPDALGAKAEFENARIQLEKLFKVFPEGIITIGNHDLRLAKRMAESGIPSWVLNSYKEMLGIPPKWDVVPETTIDGVKYIHGEGLTSNTQLSLRKVGRSIVYGHCHQGHISYRATERELMFAMACGCGIDDGSYAFEYAKNSLDKSWIGCGVVIEGKEPHLIPVDLGTKIVKLDTIVKKQRGRGRPKKEII